MAEVEAAALAASVVEAAEAVAEPNWTHHSFNADEAYVKPQESSFFVFLSTHNKIHDNYSYLQLLDCG
jgi:hypothetical protein